MSKTDLQVLYLSGTYGHKTGTRPPSCAKPRQLTIYAMLYICNLFKFIGRQNYFFCKKRVFSTKLVELM